MTHCVLSCFVVALRFWWGFFLLLFVEKRLEIAFSGARVRLSGRGSVRPVWWKQQQSFCSAKHIQPAGVKDWKSSLRWECNPAWLFKKKKKKKKKAHTEESSKLLTDERCGPQQHICSQNIRTLYVDGGWTGREPEKSRVDFSQGSAQARGSALLKSSRLEDTRTCGKYEWPRGEKRQNQHVFSFCFKNGICLNKTLRVTFHPFAKNSCNGYIIVLYSFRHAKFHTRSTLPAVGQWTARKLDFFFWKCVTQDGCIRPDLRLVTTFPSLSWIFF